MFTFTKKEKLYKFVYDEPHTTNWDLNRGFTLLISARNAAEAVSKLYKVTKNRVANITEFTEIKYDSEIKKGE